MTESAPVKQAKQELNTLADKDVDSVDSEVRYMAYGARLRTALRAGTRYIAYVCSCQTPWSCRCQLTHRPVMLVRHFAQWYRQQWSLRRMGFLGSILLGELILLNTPFLCYANYFTMVLPSDVGYESYKAYRKGPTPLEAANFSEPTRVGMIAVKRAVFQSLASMCVPSFDLLLCRAQYITSCCSAFKGIASVHHPHCRQASEEGVHKRSKSAGKDVGAHSNRPCDSSCAALSVR